MDIYQALEAKLKATAGLTALIGARLYPDEIGQGITLPAVFYRTISNEPLYTHEGVSNQESPNIEFVVYAETKASASAVAAQIRTALTDFVGVLSGITVQHIRIINDLPSRYTSADGTVKYNTHNLEFEVTYERS
jgi:hypothetical protein